MSAALLLAATTGCGDSTGAETLGAQEALPLPPVFTIERGCEPGTLTLDDGSCRAAGVQDWGCEPGELPLDDGSCLPPGIPSDGCGEGFASDGDFGCEPVLPSQDCAFGSMALPGEISCRPVAPCGAGPWGDIISDNTTVHVDASHVGTSDGSATNPFATIQEAVDAAAPGATVAIAAGSYVENVVLSAPVVLWGRCPELVEIVGSGEAAVQLVSGAAGSVVRSVALTGDDEGLRSDGGAAVTIDRAWVHDTGFIAVSGFDVPTPDALVVIDTLIENSYGTAVQALRSSLELTDSVVRDTTPTSSDGFGRALFVQAQGTPDLRFDVTHSIVERQFMGALVTFGADLQVIDSVVRDTEAQLSDGTIGYGAVIGAGVSAAFEGSLMERSHSCGICAIDSDVSITRTVVRGVEPEPASDDQGMGVFASTLGDDTAASLLVDQSLVEQSYLAGIQTESADVHVRSTVVRDVLARLSDDVAGHGIHSERVKDVSGDRFLVEGCFVERATEVGIFNGAGTMELSYSHIVDTQSHLVQGIPSGYGVLATSFPPAGYRGTSLIERTVVEQSKATAFAVVGCDATLDNVIARDTLGDQFGQFGFGVAAQPHLEDGARADLTVFGSLVEGSHTAGIVVQGADALIEATLVRETLPQVSDGYGSAGIMIQDELLVTGAQSNATVRGSIVEDNVGSGVLVLAADGVLDGIVARNNRARMSDDNGGVGVAVQSDLGGGTRAHLTLLHSLLEGNTESGILVGGADAIIDDVVVRDTRYREGTETFGDGIVVNVPFNIMDDPVAASATITRVRIENSPRAGIGNFGGFVEVGDSTFECNDIHLNSEEQTGEGYGFDNLGNNVCGCDGETTDCKVLSSGLEAPGLL